MMLSISVLTFNQGIAWKKSNAITEKELNNLAQLFDNFKSSDVIVVGLQESSDVLVNILEEVLNELDYHFLVSYTRGQMILGDLSTYIWVKNKLVEKTTYVDKTYYTCASHNQKFYHLAQVVSGSTVKGALIVNIIIDKHQLIFANCHLPFSPDKPELRNNCLLKIYEKINKMTNNESQSIFIFGDLNYRTAKHVTAVDKEIINKLSCNKSSLKIMSKLKYKDQLTIALSSGPLKESGLREAKKDFCPTCKFLESSIDRKYDGERMPSWCDRILYKGKINCNKYKSKVLSKLSDHNAVFGTFFI